MRRAVLAAAAVLAVVVVTATSAAAHTELDESVPAASTTVGGDVGRVELFFVSPFEDPHPHVTISGNSGVREGEIEIVDEFTLVATFEPLDVAGIHTVTWEVLAADGDLATGEVLFEFEPSRDAPDYRLLDPERSFTVFLVVAIAAVVAAAVVIPLGRRARRTAITGHTIEILHDPDTDDGADLAESVHTALEELGRDVEIAMVADDRARAGSSPRVLLDGEELFAGSTDPPDDDAIARALADHLGE